MRNNAVILLLLLLTACSPGPTVPQIQTAVVQTQGASLPGNVEPISTEIPTATTTMVPPFSPSQTTTPTIILTPAVISTPTITNSPTITPTPTATLPAGFSCVPSGTERTVAKVVGIIDGDTIRVDINGQVFNVRYIGMDTPESTTKVEFFGPQATTKNRELVSGKTVTLVKDVSETDQYDRLLRYVLVGDVFVNYELVRLGYAISATYPPDVACQNLFSSAEREARQNDRGFWAPTPTPKPYVPPIAPVPPTSDGGGSIPQPTQPPQSNCDPSYPSVCIPPPPPDLDCGDISYRNFPVTGSDPHGFDGEHDGYGCEN